jgi:hypothetical protein
MASFHDCSEDNYNLCRHSHAMLEAVEKNSVVLLEKALACFNKLKISASLSQCNDDGETLLVVAMKGKNVSFIDKLMLVWRMCVCSFDQSHLMSLVDQLSHHIPIVELIGYLIIDIRDEKWLQCLGLHFIQSTSFTRQDQIVALELIGAASTFGCTSEGIYNFQLALKCWKQATNLRFFPADGEPIPKIPAVWPMSVPSAVVFGSTVEVMTLEELNLFEENRKTLDLNGIKEVLIQALLVIRRYSSQNNLEHPYWLYLHSLMMFGYFFELRGFYHERKLLVNIYLLILEQLNGFDPKLIPRKTFDVFTSAIGLLAKVFREILDGSDGSPASEELNYTNLLATAEYINTISKFFPNPAMISSVEFKNYFDHRCFSFAEIIFHFLYVLDEISPEMSNQEKKNLEEYYSNLIRNFFAHQTSTVLHIILDSFWFFDFNVDTIPWLLKLGADPNAVDEKGQTPLHILAGDGSLLLEEFFVPYFRALVDADAHLHSANDDGETVISILKENLLSIKESGRIAQPYFESLVNTVFPLRSFCAQVIRRNAIPFNRLPSRLQSFVAMHSFVEGKDFVNQTISFRLLTFFTFHLEN